MSPTANQLQFRPLVVLTAAFVAAIWLGWSSLAIIRDPSHSTVFRQPSFDKPDPFNARLDRFQAIRAAIDQQLPTEVPLRYLSQRDGADQFDFLKAVLAPRRIGQDVDSLYLFVYAETPDWLASEPELKNARPVISLFGLTGIYLKNPSK